MAESYTYKDEEGNLVRITKQRDDDGGSRGKKRSSKKSSSYSGFDIWFRLGMFAAFFAPTFVAINSKDSDWTDKTLLMITVLSGTVLLVIEHDN